MSWGAIGGTVAAGVVGGLMSDDKNGGAGTQTATKEPWEAAAPWLRGLLGQGQALNDQYAAQPFSAQQQAAYQNQYGQSDYMRQLIPGLLGQLSGQQVGFDKSNPTARVKGYDFGGGLLGPNLHQAGLLNAAPVAAPAQQAQAASPFTQNRALEGFTPANVMAMQNPSSLGGGLGAFKYGDAMPQPGTQAYRDFQEYLQWGGTDPSYLYSQAPRYEGGS